MIDNEDGFGGLYAMPGNVGLFARRCKNPVLVASTDGVGTKLKVARRAGGTVVERQIDIDARIVLQELGQPGHRQQLGQSRRGADPQGAGRRGHGVRYLGLGGLDLQQN